MKKQEKADLIIEMFGMINTNRIKELEALLKNDNKILKYVYDRFDDPLILAIEVGNLNAVKVLIKYGMDVNHHKEGEVSYLSRAVLSEDVEIFEYLLRFNKDINTKGKNGNTALHLAAEFNVTKIIKILLKAGADYTITNTEGLVPAKMGNTAKGLINKTINSKKVGKYSDLLGDI